MPAARAEAICEAVTRPSMRFVPVKTPDNQAVLAPHRARQGFVKARTAQGHQIQLGVRACDPTRPGPCHKAHPADSGKRRERSARHYAPLVARLAAHLQELDRQAHDLETHIQACQRQNADSQRVARIPDIGPITAAALVASIGEHQGLHGWPPVRRLARTRAPAAFERWQAHALRDEQARMCTFGTLLTHDTRRAIRGAGNRG